MSKCRDCQKDIVWAISPAGKRIPLEKVVVYEPEPATDDVEMLDLALSLAAPKVRKIDGNTYISHFLTCPGANKFSGRNR